jgi:kynurenine formamidase
MTSYVDVSRPGLVLEFVALEPRATRRLGERGVRLVVCIDYLSIAPYADPAPKHQVRAGRGAGPWHLTCWPLRISGADGAPERALLDRDWIDHGRR